MKLTRVQRCHHTTTNSVGAGAKQPAAGGRVLSRCGRCALCGGGGVRQRARRSLAASEKNGNSPKVARPPHLISHTVRRQSRERTAATMAPKRESAHNKSASSRDGVAAPAAGHGKPAAVAACPAGDLVAEQRQQTYAANAKLCQLVERHPCLYDRGHENYAKKQVLDRTWELIAKECDDQVLSCKERWRNIRAAFARSINLYKTHGGPNRVKPYYLHKELQFIIEFMKDARDKRQSDDIDTTKDEPDDENPDDNYGDQQHDADIISIAHTPRTERASPMEAEVELPVSGVEQEAPQSSGFSRPQQSDCELMSVADAVPPCGVIPKKIKLHSASNEDANFLETLLPDMRSMNARQKVLFKAKVYQAIREVLDTTANFPCSRSAAPTVPTTAQGIFNSIVSLSESELQRLRAFTQGALVLGGRQPMTQVAVAVPSDNAADSVQRPQLQPWPLLVKAENEELDSL